MHAHSALSHVFPGFGTIHDGHLEVVPPQHFKLVFQ
jgi:hypothetical protein